LCDLPADFVDRAGFPVQAPQDNSFNELVIFERIQAKPLYIVKSLPQQLDCLKKYITDTWKADPVMVRHFQTKMDKLLLKSTPFSNPNCCAGENPVFCLRPCVVLFFQ